MAKKRATKGAAKKVRSKKAAVRKPSKSARPVAAASSAMPAKPFSGKTFALAGRFTYNPEKSQLLEFLKKQGGKVAAKINRNVDYLLLGEGGVATAKKQADKLNESGDAAIEMIEDVEELFQLDAERSVAILCEPASVDRLVAFQTNFNWYYLGCDLSGTDFRKKSLGSNRQTLFLNLFELRGCRFDDAWLINLVFDAEASYRSCSFQGTKMDRVHFMHARDLNLDSVRADNLSLHDSSTLVTNSHIDGLKTSLVRKLTLDGCTVNEFVVPPQLRAEFKRIHANDTKFTSAEIGNATFVGAEFTDVVFQRGELRQIRFEKCKFNNVKFRDLVIDANEFIKCDLDGVTFQNCEIVGLGLATSKISDLRFTKCKQAGIRIPPKSESAIAGLDASGLMESITSSPAKRIATAMLNAEEFVSTIKAKVNGRAMTFSLSKSWYCQDFEWKASGKGKGPKEAQWRQGNWVRRLNQGDVLRAFEWLSLTARGGQPDMGSMTIKTASCPLKAKEAREVLAELWSEIFAAQAPVAGEQAKLQQAKSRTKKENKALVTAALEAEDPKAVAAVGAEAIFAVRDFKKLKLAGKKLPGVKLKKLHLQESNFSGGTLDGADLTGSSLRKANFSKCSLKKAKLRETDLRNADFSNADLSNAVLAKADLSGANVASAKLDDLNLSGAKLFGVDFTKAAMRRVQLDKARYDRTTILPPSLPFDSLDKMDWCDNGPAPHTQKRHQKVTGKIDFPTFMKRLTEITDSSRLKKALSMLKKESFQLFSEVSDVEVIGVIKSQTDDDLVYSARLSVGGWFSCCTQNLNPCGGLRGAICKHILVLVIGLAQSGELEARDVDEWINESKLRRPDLDKERMSEILLKYKGVEAGDVDWRPTETVPEDFYVL